MRSYAATRGRDPAQGPDPERAAVLLHGAQAGDDAEPDRRDRRRVLRRAGARPRPDDRPERERAAVRHHVGRGLAGGGRRDRVLPGRSPLVERVVDPVARVVARRRLRAIRPRIRAATQAAVPSGRRIRYRSAVRGMRRTRRRWRPQSERAPEKERHEEAIARPRAGLAATILVAACSGSTATQAPASAPASEAPASSGASEAPASASPAAEAANVRLQLQWAPQAQFAGYFAADKQGYFAEEGLDRRRSSTAARRSSRSRSARPRTGPSSRSRWVPKVLEAREAGSDLVDIAQIFQRSGTLSVAWKDSGIADSCEARRQEGRRLGLRQRVRGHRGPAPQLRPDAGPREQRRSGHAVPEGHPGFDMVAFLNKRDRRRRGDDLQRVRPGPRGDEPGHGRAVQARGPQRHQLERLPASRCSRTRSSSARRGSTRSGNRDIAVRFVRASLKGWIYCRDNPDDCVQYTTDAGQPARRRPPGAG